MVILPERERESAICPLNMQSSTVGGSIPTLMVASPLFCWSNIAMVVKYTAFGGYYSPWTNWETLRIADFGTCSWWWNPFIIVKDRKSMYFFILHPYVYSCTWFKYPQSFLFSSFCLLMTSLWFFMFLKAEHPPPCGSKRPGAPWPGREALGATGGTAAHHWWVGKLQIFVGPTTQRLPALELVGCWIAYWMEGVKSWDPHNKTIWATKMVEWLGWKIWGTPILRNLNITGRSAKRCCGAVVSFVFA